MTKNLDNDFRETREFLYAQKNVTTFRLKYKTLEIFCFLKMAFNTLLHKKIS